MYRLNSKVQQFMVGRCGVDELGKFISQVTLVCLLVSLLTGWSLFYWGALFLIFYSYFRMFSRNIPKRYAENQKFLTWRYKVVAKWNLTKKHMAERKTYRFFKCPQCKQKVRVPKGRGKICITCPKCKKEFVKKS
ncbi:MAG: hypothetical protein IJZ23_07270 [Roseburia sp.]|nr:hypothetical protein [Roseburia sp.]